MQQNLHGFFVILSLSEQQQQQQQQQRYLSMLQPNNVIPLTPFFCFHLVNNAVSSGCYSSKSSPW
jgi:hypothetical protein